MGNYGTAIDKKWQKKWEETELYKFDPNNEGEKLYVLEMFSYPSGSQLHAGHWFNYGPVDSWARLKKCKDTMYSNQWALMPLVYLLKTLQLKQEFIHRILLKRILKLWKNN